MIDWRRLRWAFGVGHKRERLSALLDDELGVDDALRVTRHVAACSHCLAELEAIRQARDALRSLPRVEPPPEVYVQLLATPPPAEPPPVVWTRRVVSGLAASAALIAAVAFLAGGQDEGTVAPPVDVFVVDHVTSFDDGPLIIPVNLGR